MTQHETQDDLLLYALRELPTPERSRVEAHVSSCAQCRREMEGMQGTLGIALMTVAQPAPVAAVRERLLREIHSEGTRPSGRGHWLWIPVLASVLLAVLCVWLWRENAALREKLQTATRLTPSDPAQQIRDLLAASDTERFTLTPVKSAPVPQGQTFYRATTGTLVFVGSHLPTIPSDKAYELWLLPASGAAPVPAGVFKPDAGGNVVVVLPKLTAGVSAKGFAITIEQESGSATPTLPIVMAGMRS